MDEKVEENENSVFENRVWVGIWESFVWRNKVRRERKG